MNWVTSAVFLNFESEPAMNLDSRLSYDIIMRCSIYYYNIDMTLDASLTAYSENKSQNSN